MTVASAIMRCLLTRLRNSRTRIELAHAHPACTCAFLPVCHVALMRASFAAASCVERAEEIRRLQPVAGAGHRPHVRCPPPHPPASSSAASIRSPLYLSLFYAHCKSRALFTHAISRAFHSRFVIQVHQRRFGAFVAGPLQCSGRPRCVWSRDVEGG